MLDFLKSNAFWTAVAAIAAAVSAFLSMRVARMQRIESIEASRPELILTDWWRDTRQHNGKAYPYIAFGTVKNVGGGPALNVVINARAGDAAGSVDPRPAMSSFHADIIPASAFVPVDSTATVSLWWENVPAAGDTNKQIVITILASCWGRRHAFRYDTSYDLLVYEDPQRATVGNAIAPGVAASRETKMRRVSWLRWQGRMRRIPLLGRLSWFRDPTYGRRQ